MEKGADTKEAETLANAEENLQNRDSNKTEAVDEKTVVQDDCNKLDESALNASCGPEETVTLQEIIDSQEQLEEEAADLLGGESGNVCTFPLGYKPRQPLYSCRDCTVDSSQAGICYGCSINCHDGHDLVELYTKRDFCCDCGNSKFKNKCKLYEEKQPLNERNKYNHNFAGLYCTCNQPYTGDEDMFQCCICEDWFHLEHLSEEPTTTNVDETEEIICGKCVERVQFLRAYSDNNYQKEKLVDEKCKLKQLVELQQPTDSAKGALSFRSYHWRKRLCTCRDCSNMYEDLGVPYLTDVADCVEEFVINNRKAAEPKLATDSEDRKVNRMVVESFGPEAAISLFAGFEEMKAKVMNAMKRAADEGREVRKEDINAAFAELETARKRRRLGEVSTSGGAE